MKKLINAILIVNFLLLHIGCIGVAYEKCLIKGYFLEALDSEDEMELLVVDPNDYAFGVIPATVFSVGYDSNYIIAKQHPRVSVDHVRKEITNYYIVPIAHPPKSYEHSGAIGPLTEQEFNKKKRELGVKIDFSFTLENLK